MLTLTCKLQFTTLDLIQCILQALKITILPNFVNITEDDEHVHKIPKERLKIKIHIM